MESGMSYETSFFPFRERRHTGNSTSFTELARLRYREFVLRRGWKLPSIDDCEFDQYDNLWAWYLVIKAHNTVVAGMRFVPSLAHGKSYSYMIRDAQEGVIDLPRDLLYDVAPTSCEVWEGTRTCLSNQLSHTQRKEVWQLLAAGIKGAGAFCHAEKVITFTPASWPRWYPVVGLEAKAIGPVLEVAGAAAQCVEIDVRTSNRSRLH